MLLFYHYSFTKKHVINFDNFAISYLPKNGNCVCMYWMQKWPDNIFCNIFLIFGFLVGNTVFANPHLNAFGILWFKNQYSPNIVQLSPIKLKLDCIITLRHWAPIPPPNPPSLFNVHVCTICHNSAIFKNMTLIFYMATNQTTPTKKYQKIKWKKYYYILSYLAPSELLKCKCWSVCLSVTWSVSMSVGYI